MKTALIFTAFFLTCGSCFAVFNTDNEFDKYGFTEHRYMLIDRSLWGYRLAYSRKAPNICAYVLQKIPKLGNSTGAIDKITFKFKARLYPVAPDTKDMERVIKAYVKDSLGVTKVHKVQTGVVCAPAFVVSAVNNIGRKTVHRSFPVQYRKGSDRVTEIRQSGDPITLLFWDTRLLPFNIFQSYDMEITFDYLNRIVSFNCNGNKVILRDQSIINVWSYFGLANFFNIGVNKTTVIAPQYEFTTIKTCINENKVYSEEKRPRAFPRLKCSYYKDIIEKKKDVDAMFCLGLNYYEGKGGADKDYYQAFKWFKEAAMREHVFAQYYLGLCHLYGRGTPQDDNKAWKWLFHASKYFYDKAEVLAAQCVIDKVKVSNDLNRERLLQSFLGPGFFQGNANACFLQSYCAHYNIGKNGLKYLDGFKDAARRGHPKAYYYLGLHFEQNKNTEKIAFRCYEEAAARAFVPAFVKLGMCCSKGQGTVQNQNEAFKWFEKAAHAGDPEGIFRLGCCYLLGEGVKENRKKALDLFQAAVKKASPRALLALLLLEENNSASSFFRGNDRAANDEPAKQTKNTYQSRRAICSKYGIGTVKSPERALNLLRMVPTDNPLIAFELADSYETCSEKSKAFFNAVNLYKQAAARGNLRAACKLGRLYERLGENIDAMLYYRQAAKGGHAEAAFELAQLLRKDSASNRRARQKEIFALFEKAAQNGNVQAYYELGDCYYKGLGVNADLKLAGECWEKYENAFRKEQNNSIHGIYWGDLPFQRPIEYDEDGLPRKYLSDLRNKKEILAYYKKY